MNNFKYIFCGKKYYFNSQRWFNSCLIHNSISAKSQAVKLFPQTTDMYETLLETLKAILYITQDAREAMRVVFFCTRKTYLYAQNEISYEYIQILF